MAYPHFRHELICALIKSLPKTLRRNFVPAPNYADAVLAAIEPMQGNLLDAISTRLLRMTGVRVDPDVWDLTTLAPHLRLQFEVRDEHDKLLARGLNLEKLKAQLKGKVTDTLSKVADKGIEEDLTQWSLVNYLLPMLKSKVNMKSRRFLLWLIKKTPQSLSCSITNKKHKSPSTRLASFSLLNVPSPIKYLQQNLPNKSKLGLYFNPFGKVNDLIDDCIAAAVDSLLIVLQYSY